MRLAFRGGPVTLFARCPHRSMDPASLHKPVGAESPNKPVSFVSMHKSAYVCQKGRWKAQSPKGTQARNQCEQAPDLWS